MAGLMTLAFRNNRDHLRYGLWLSASLKFLLPFSLLISLGSRLEWAPAAHAAAVRPAITLTMARTSRPFSGNLPLAPSTPDTRDWAALAIFGVWACGFLSVGLIRFHGWRRIRAAVRSSVPVDIATVDIPIRSSPGLLEPGVVGLFRPVLLLPAGIAGRLKPCQLEAVLAHELCHVRRRDNWTAAIHMVVEAVFWFHPLVWWIGARLVEERERACDETVLSLGNEPRDYAEGILNICKSYLESPLACVSGVTGSDLKKRIQAILRGDIGRDLTFAKKLALATAGIAALGAPVAIGIGSAPGMTSKFEVATIRSCEAFSKRPVPDSPERLQPGCTTVERLIQQAYGVFANGHGNPLSSVTVAGGPAWIRSGFYKIEAKAAGRPSHATMNGPMLQALLEDRFKLKIHRETREVPVYTLTVAKGGPRLQPFQGSCVPWNFDDPPDHPAAPTVRCPRGDLRSNGLDLDAATMADLRYFLLVTLNRPVIDKTGMPGRFNFHLDLPGEDLGFFRRAHGSPATSDPATPPADVSLISAIKIAVKKLGLNLEPTTGPGEFIVIDRVERPIGG
jgi:uncharacterized protein (TIGR03435 family)